METDYARLNEESLNEANDKMVDLLLSPPTKLIHFAWILSANLNAQQLLHLSCFSSNDLAKLLRA